VLAENYRLIIFDFDGTLADSKQGIIHCMSEAFAEFGLPRPSEEAVMKTISLKLNDALLLLCPQLSTEEIARLKDIFRGLYRTKGMQMMRPFKETKKLMDHLARNRLSLAAVSNKSVSGLEFGLQKFGIKEHMRIIYGIREGWPYKPDPRVYTEHIKPVFPHITTDEILVVGDAVTDLAFAENIGADCCFAAYGYGDREKCRAYNPTYIINSLSELLPEDKK